MPATGAQATRFGIHLGLQDAHPADIISAARHTEAAGYSWVSLWDHFASVSPADGGSLEAVAMHAAVAAATDTVTVGMLVYCAGYRHPLVLAQAVATIDLLSGGRAAMGLGAGWSEREHRALGQELPPPGRRVDRLAEAASCVRSLLHDGSCDFRGEHFTMEDARCLPRPHQVRVPVWIGGAGERRTLAVVASHADGWNAPFLSPEEFARKLGVLHEHCHQQGRDPATLQTAVNVAVAPDARALGRHFESLGDVHGWSRHSVITGRGEQLAAGLQRYVAAGANQVNVAIRAPFDPDVVDAVAEALALTT